MTKFRTCFVSNSSSSSFIIGFEDLSLTQLDQIFRICEGPIGPWEDSWAAREEDGKLIGFTIMDNGVEEGMEAELKKLDVDMSKVKWERY